MVKKSFLFILLLALLSPGASSAQEMKSMRVLNTKVSGLLPPWFLLPDHIRSARVTPHLCAECEYSGVSPADVIRQFSLSAYPDNNEYPDLLIDAYVDLLPPDVSLKSGAEGNQQAVFWYQTPIKAHTRVKITDQTGQHIYTDERTVSHLFDGPKGSTPQIAFQRWQDKTTTPKYQAACKKAITEAIHRVSGTLKERYDFQPETVTLYYPDGCEEAFAEQVRKTQALLLQLTNNQVPDTISEQWQALVRYFDSRMLQLKPASGKQRPLYYACGMNLANMHRSVREYDQARYYIRRLIDADIEDSAPLAALLAERLQHQVFLEDYGHTGVKMEEYEQQTQKARTELLARKDELTGYIVLTNRQVVNGTFLHPWNHFQEQKIKVKYEKRLNDPITDREFSITEVREMHGDDWHLAFIEYGANMYLSDIIWQSPVIFLARPMAGISLRKSDKAVIQNDWFVQKSTVPDAVRINADHVADALSGYLDDCPTVAQRIKYGYYTARQAPDMVKDYSNTCPREPTAPNKASATGKSPGFYLGYQTGYNSFTSAIGMTGTFRVYRRLFARAGGGFGIWGAKLGAGIKYDMRRDMRYSKGWSYTLGYGYSTGTKSAFSFGNSNTTDVAGQPVSSTDYYVTVRPLKVQTISTSAVFNKFYGARTVVQLELGYALALQKKPWELAPESVNPEQSMTVLKMFAPGGLIFSAGIHWAL